MKYTNVMLSKVEQECVENAEWILTKHRIIQKVYLSFGDIHKYALSLLAAHPTTKEFMVPSA